MALLLTRHQRTASPLVMDQQRAIVKLRRRWLAALHSLSREKRLTSPERLDVVRPLQHFGCLFGYVPSPAIMLVGRGGFATVDLGYEYGLDDLVGIGSVRLPPLVDHRETVRGVRRTDLCRREPRLLMDLSRSSLKKGLAFLDRPVTPCQKAPSSGTRCKSRYSRRSAWGLTRKTHTWIGRRNLAML